MPIIRIPNGWRPRPYQMEAWKYLENGGKHCELVWARRHGKDEVALHRTAVAAFERQANYWHMLPEATQARKAIWKAINPHTGKRRIDEAFPLELRSATNETEMLITFKNGSTWQVVGSDNFNSLVGSAPAGIVYSEWALSNPSARAYLRPIISENNGWQIFVGTPRGRNHAHDTYQSARKDPNAFAQLLTAADSGVFSPEQLIKERQSYIEDFGDDMGNALFEQEYLCSFDAAILGAYYGKEIADARQQGRVCVVEYDPSIPVHAVFDIGQSDDTAIIWFQMILGEVHVIDAYSTHGKPIKHYIDILDGKPYKYATIGSKPMVWLPHDARAKTFAASGKSTEQQFNELGYAVRIVPSLSIQDGIQAARKTFPIAYFDETKCYDLLDAISQYQREWDDAKKCFRDAPRHDWTSHYADALRYMAIVWKQEAEPKAPQPARFDTQLSINELVKRQTQKRMRG